jgi:hypothetical protein
MRVLSVAPCLLAGVAIAQTGPAGHWEGGVTLPDREMKLNIDVSKDDKGAWMGTLAQPEQNVKNVPLSAVKFEGKNLKFKVGNGDNAAEFDCDLDGAVLKCIASNAMGSTQAGFKRTGEAKIEQAKASGSVSKELEGDWEGTLETPNGTLPVIVHLKNQPDNTVKGTMDSPKQGAKDLPLSDIVQKAESFEFQLPMAGGSFKGTVNKEGTQVTGNWSQGGGSLPLTLKKAGAN